MRYSISFILLVALAACGGEGVVVRGTLADGGDDATRVWVVGGGVGLAVRDSTFQITSDSAGTLALRFADEDGEISRMVLEGVAPGANLLLSGVWINRSEGLAFPAAVTGDGDDLISVNGLRVALGDARSGEVDIQGTVLAAGDDAIMVRPVDAAFGDLRVVVTPGTSVHSPDEDPADAGELEFGDSIRVRGMVLSNYIVATEVVTPRRAGRSDEAESYSDGDDWVDEMFGGVDDDGERGKSEERGNRGKNGNGNGNGND